MGFQFYYICVFRYVRFIKAYGVLNSKMLVYKNEH